jgi:3-deoxy-manno-octulosonate cytidylyltransferase (CMP-KDO synthetase)
MKAAIVIPARYGSSRFSGKPLHIISGISMLERVWRIAKSVPNCSRVVVATEDVRIVSHAQSFGAEAVLTSDQCSNGTERVYAAIDAAQITEDILLNLQGDALLTPPWVLETMILEIQKERDVDIVTPAVRLEGEALTIFRQHKQTNPASGSTVVFDQNFNALYFSKAILPQIRKEGFTSIYRHIGLYGYRRDSLKTYVELSPTPLEQTEGLEQLRALEHGMKVRVAVVDYKGRTHGSVDAPEDVSLIEDIIKREGELVIK